MARPCLKGTKQNKAYRREPARPIIPALRRLQISHCSSAGEFSDSVMICLKIKNKHRKRWRCSSVEDLSISPQSPHPPTRSRHVGGTRPLPGAPFPRRPGLPEPAEVDRPALLCGGALPPVRGPQAMLPPSRPHGCHVELGSRMCPRKAQPAGSLLFPTQRGQAWGEWTFPGPLC